MSHSRSRHALRPVARAVVDRVTWPVGSLITVTTDQPAIALTFDDGPDPVGTPAALRLLAERRATATFFVLLTRARRFPTLLEEVRAAGHEIALHGVDHRRLTRLPKAEVGVRVRDGKDELEQRTGATVRWFRPPYGAQNLAVWRAVRRTGMESVFWGPSLWDWRETSEEARAVKAHQGLRPGAIVLAHDGIAGPADHAEDAETTLPLDRSAWWDAALSSYARSGLAARSLSEVVGSGRPVRAARFVS